jgi:hypothetical protein
MYWSIVVVNKLLMMMMSKIMLPRLTTCTYSMYVSGRYRHKVGRII